MIAQLTDAAAALAASHGQGWRQVGELLLAFALSTVIGLERQVRGKAAGLRTQTIVGTTSALILLVSKYGFTDVIASGQVVLDPSRVAAQIVSGIGFLGAGLILTRQGAVRGLTTAAAVWETAALGMAAGAGLWVLAVVVTALHFVAVLGYTAVARHLPGARTSALSVRVSYLDGQGVLRRAMAAATGKGWLVGGLAAEDSVLVEHEGGRRQAVAVTLGLSGAGQREELLGELARVDGVLSVQVLTDDDID